MKKILLSVVLACPLFAASEAFKIPRQALLAPSNVKLFYGDRGFSVRHGGRDHEVSSADLDATMRRVTRDNISKYLLHGKIGITRASDGSYLLRSHIDGRGGGVWGAYAGVMVGKFAVSFIGHGAIHLAALATGPAYYPTMMALESTFGTAIEAASTSAACALGIATAVVTGPV